VNIRAIGTKSFFTLTGEFVSTSGASTIWLLEASSSVCPSGAARATVVQPIAPELPGMFSSTKLCPNFSLSWSA
jgi:hypothetical protein